MSEDAVQDDPFSPTALDEATELRALSQALQLAQDFKLIFVRCNQSDQRNRLVVKLRNELPAVNIQEIQFAEPLTHLLDELRTRIGRPTPDAVFLSGLEYSLPNAEDAHSTAFVANLNASRNSFPDVVHFPLVLWIPEYVLNAIILGAPDFFSIRSGVYFFAAGPGETADLAQSLMVGQVPALASLTLEEKLERVKAIESLLADYESLPTSKRDPESELRLLSRLATLTQMLGSHDTARVYFQQVLDQAKKLGKLDSESVGYGGLGIAYRDLGQLEEAKAAFERALEISRNLGDQLGEAMDLRNIGNLHVSLGEWEDARLSHQKSLEIIRQLGDKVQEAQTLVNLGTIDRHQGRFSEAEEFLKEALQIAHTIGDKYTEGVSLQTLGTVNQNLGRMLEAEKAYQQGLQIALDLGDYEGAWNTLHNQSVLREALGDLSGATDSEKRAVEILEGIKAKELPRELFRLAELERKTKEQEESQKQPA